jgi:hypothetical protein
VLDGERERISGSRAVARAKRIDQNPNVAQEKRRGAQIYIWLTLCSWPKFYSTVS